MTENNVKGELRGEERREGGKGAEGELNTVCHILSHRKTIHQGIALVVLQRTRKCVTRTHLFTCGLTVSTLRRPIDE